MKRRQLLVAVGGAGVSLPGCAGTSSPPTNTPPATATPSPTQTPDPPPRGSAATITDTKHSIEDEFPYDEYIIVTVDVRHEPAPRLRARIDGCQDKTVSRSLSVSQARYRFGPFGHHCIEGYNVWLEGCRETA